MVCAQRMIELRQRRTLTPNSYFLTPNCFYKTKKLLSQIAHGTGANALLRYHPD